MIRSRRLPAWSLHSVGKFVSILFIFLAVGTSAPAQSWSLFNGKDLTGWHVDVPAMDTNSAAINPFIIRNGLLVSLGRPNGHLITDSVYQNYRLNVEYRFAGKPGKSPDEGLSVFQSKRCKTIWYIRGSGNAAI